jgi:hypothetical protein
MDYLGRYIDIRTLRYIILMVILSIDGDGDGDGDGDNDEELFLIVVEKKVERCKIVELFNTKI